MTDHATQLIQPQSALTGDRARQLSRRWSRASSELTAVVATYRSESHALQQRLEQSRALLRAAEAELERTRLNGTPDTTEQDDDIVRLRATATGPDDVDIITTEPDPEPEAEVDVLDEMLDEVEEPRTVIVATASAFTAAPEDSELETIGAVTTVRRPIALEEPPARTTLTRDVVTHTDRTKRRSARTSSAGSIAEPVVFEPVSASTAGPSGPLMRQRTSRSALLIDGDAVASSSRYAGGVNRRRMTLLFKLAHANRSTFDSVDVIFDGQLSASAPERPTPGVRVRITRPGVAIDAALETVAATHGGGDLTVVTDNEAPGGVRRARGRRVIDADTMFEVLSGVTTIGRE